MAQKAFKCDVAIDGGLDVGVIHAPNIITILASVALTAGNFVNIYDNAGTPNVRKADASLARPAHGFVIANVSNGAQASVIQLGINALCSGLLGGDVWLGNAGAPTNTPPTTAGYVSQRIGTAISATAVKFDPDMPILIAAAPVVAPRAVPRITSPVYASALTFDFSQYDMGVVTLTGNLVASFTGGVEGQVFRLRFKQDATGGRVLSFGTGDHPVRLGTDISVVILSTAANKTDYLAVAFNAVSSFYEVVSLARGF